MEECSVQHTSCVSVKNETDEFEYSTKELEYDQQSIIMKEEWIEDDDISNLSSFRRDNEMLTWDTYHWQCHICPKFLFGYKALNDHIRISHNISKIEDIFYQCMDCNQSYINYTNFLNHVHEHHECLILCCDVCSAKFLSYMDIADHRNKHIKDADSVHPPVFYCTMCKLAYSTEAELAHHKEFSHQFLFQHEEERFNCTTSQEMFGSSLLLEKHTKIHSKSSAIEEQPTYGRLKGELCTVTCDEEQLKHHTMSHTDECLHKCNPKCFKFTYEFKRGKNTKISSKKCLTLNEKIEIINIAENESLATRAIAKRFQIGKTQAALIIKNKEVFKQKWKTGASNEEKKSFLNANGTKIDQICIDWFSHARLENIPINGRLIKEKALQAAKQLGINDFKASDGWLQSWRKRHNISFKCITTETTTVSQEAVNDIKSKIPSIILGYRPEDIYNIDEAGLLYRALPNITSLLKSEKCEEVKLSEERLTILFCVSMAGEKLEILVIGNANYAIDNFTATWKSNKDAYMTRDILKEWLIEFDRKIAQQKRKVILFLDNVTSHLHEIELENIKLVFFPSNATSTCQPLEMGIIKHFKFFYREAVLVHMLGKKSVQENSSGFERTFTILDALFFLKFAWDKVSSSTIRNCFQKSGFKEKSNTVNDFGTENNLPLSALSKFLQSISKWENLDEQSLKSFLEVDDDLITEGPSMELSSSDNNSIKSYAKALEVVNNLKIFAGNDVLALKPLKDLELHFEYCLFKQKQNKLN